MNAITAATIAVLFGTGAYLMVRKDAIALVAGTLLVSNSAVLMLVSSGFGAEQAPVAPVRAWEEVSDPLVQALALTAIVISFGTTVLLLRITLAVERTHGTLGIDDLVRSEQYGAIRGAPPSGPRAPTGGEP